MGGGWEALRPQQHQRMHSCGSEGRTAASESRGGEAAATGSSDGGMKGGRKEWESALGGPTVWAGAQEAGVDPMPEILMERLNSD